MKVSNSFFLILVYCFSSANAAEVTGSAKMKVSVTGAVTNIAIGGGNRQSISIGSVQGKNARTGNFSANFGKTGVIFNVGVNGVGFGSSGPSFGGEQEVEYQSVTD